MLSVLSTVPTAQDALTALISSEGNIALAAERLRCQPAHLIQSLTTGIPFSELQNTFRTLMSIHLYQSIMTTSRVYEAVLVDLDPIKVASTYTTLLNLLASITQNQVAPVNINLQETVLKLLPPEIRQTVVELVNNGDDDN